jgi:hypothetical protein
MTSRSEPAGGEKLAVDRVLAPYVLCTAAGLDASTVIPPEHVPVGLGDGLVVVGVGLGLVVVGVGLGLVVVGVGLGLVVVGVGVGLVVGVEQDAGRTSCAAHTKLSEWLAVQPKLVAAGVPVAEAERLMAAKFPDWLLSFHTSTFDVVDSGVTVSVASPLPMAA